MIFTFTDFGHQGPYTGQMLAVLARQAPGVPVIDLMADAPAFNPKAAAYLLAALVPDSEPGDVFLAVVDPGVGSARRPVVVQAARRWFVGPDNGLFALVCRRTGPAPAPESPGPASPVVQAWEITWRPPRLSNSFHGRDLFAPVAARLARGEPPPGQPIPAATLDRPDWPDDLPEIIYCDAFGNAMTGLRAATLSPTATLHVGPHTLPPARTFTDHPPATPFWYPNSLGLAEIAVRDGSAATALGLEPAVPIR